MNFHESENGSLFLNSVEATNAKITFPGIAGKLKKKLTVKHLVEANDSHLLNFFKSGSAVIIQPLTRKSENQPQLFSLTAFTHEQSSSHLPEGQRDIVTGETVTVSLKKPQKILKFIEQYVRITEPLFPSTDSPALEEICQSLVPNCFFLAAVQAILNHPEGKAFIRGMMVRHDDDTTTVRLFNPETHAPEYVRVPNSVLMGEGAISLNKHGAMWVHVLENAYTALGYKKDRKVDSSFLSVFNHGGQPSFAFSVLTGLPAEQILLKKQVLPLLDPSRFDLYNQAEEQLTMWRILLAKQVEPEDAAGLDSVCENSETDVSEMDSEDAEESGGAFDLAIHDSFEPLLEITQPDESIRKEVQILLEKTLSADFINRLSGVPDVFEEFIQYYIEEKEGFVAIVENPDWMSEEKIIQLLDACFSTLNLAAMKKEAYQNYARSILTNVSFLESFETICNKRFIDLYGELFGRWIYVFKDELEKKNVFEELSRQNLTVPEKLLKFTSIFFESSGCDLQTKISLYERLMAALKTENFKDLFSVFAPKDEAKAVNEVLFNFLNENWAAYRAITKKSIPDYQKILELIDLTVLKDATFEGNVLKAIYNYYFVPLDKSEMRGQSEAFSGVYTKDERQLYETIEKALEEGKLLAAGTSASEKIPGLVGQHAYTILGVEKERATSDHFYLNKEAEALYLRIRNPWGSVGLIYDPATRLPEIDKDCEFKIELKHFYQEFRTLYCSNSADGLFSIEEQIATFAQKLVNHTAGYELTVYEDAKRLIKTDTAYQALEEELFELHLALLNKIPKIDRQEIERLWATENSKETILEKLNRTSFEHLAGEEQAVKEHIYQLLAFERAKRKGHKDIAVEKELRTRVLEFPIQPHLWKHVQDTQDALKLIVKARLQRAKQLKIKFNACCQRVVEHLDAAKNNLHPEGETLQYLLEEYSQIKSILHNIMKDKALYRHFNEGLSEADWAVLNQRSDELIMKIRQLNLTGMPDLPLIQEIIEQAILLNRSGKLQEDEFTEIMDLLQTQNWSDKDCLRLEQLVNIYQQSKNPDIIELGQTMSRLAKIVYAIRELINFVVRPVFRMKESMYTLFSSGHNDYERLKGVEKLTEIGCGASTDSNVLSLC